MLAASLNMLKMDDFGEKYQAYSLTFLCKMVILGYFFMLAASLNMLKMDDFGENTKPIALLFGEKWSYFDTFSL